MLVFYDVLISLDVLVSLDALASLDSNGFGQIAGLIHVRTL